MFKRLLVSLVILPFVFAGVATAQDSFVPTEEALETPAIPDDNISPIPLQDAGTILFGDILNIIGSYGLVVGGAATVIIGLLKYLPPLSGVSAPILNVFVNGALVVGLWVATHFGFTESYQGGLGTIVTVGQAVLGLLSAMLGSSFIHRASVKADLPVVGYKRTDTT